MFRGRCRRYGERNKKMGSERYTPHNVEVQVALLRNGLFKKDLAKLLKIESKHFPMFFGREHPQEVQTMMIDIVNLIGKGAEPSEEDLTKYKALLKYVRDYKIGEQAKVDDRTIAFVRKIEEIADDVKMHKEREIDDLCEKFCV